MFPAPHPRLPPTVELVYRRARRWWMWTLLTPVIYLSLAQTLRWMRVIDGPEGEHDWDGPVWWVAVVACGTGVLVALAIVRRRQRIRVRRRIATPDEALSVWTRDFLTQVSMADTLALLGLIDFALSGRFGSLLIAGMFSYAGYALAFPRPTDLEDLPEPDNAEPE